jgi:hypothetical protein
MLRKSICAISILFLTAAMTFAQGSSSPVRPGLHLKDDTPSRSKEQKEYDNAVDRQYRSTVKDIPDQRSKKSDPWGDIRTAPPDKAKNKP